MNGRAYDASKDHDAAALGRVSLRLTSGERTSFAEAFLAFNDHLLCTTESHEDGEVHGIKGVRIESVPRKDVAWSPDVVERLHQAWQLSFQEERAMYERLMPSLGIVESVRDLYQSVVGASYEHLSVRDVHRSVLGIAAPVELGFGEDLAAKAFGKLGSLGSVVGGLESPLTKVIDGLKGSIAGSLAVDLDMWSTLGVRSNASLAIAKSSYESSLSPVLDAFSRVNLLRDDDVAAGLLASSHAYSTYVKQTALQSGNASLRPAYDAALKFAASQYAASNDAVRHLIEDARSDITVDALARTPSLELFPRQRDELVERRRREPEATEADLLERSPLTRPGTRARRVAQLVVLCNQAAQLRGLEMFKPTTRVLQACLNLPQAAPMDELTLGAAVDDLYFMLYEGAGGDTLRFVDNAGGPFARDAEHLAGVWHLKFLRNKWLRHDPEHGTPTSIRKNHEKLAGTLAALGITGLPTTPADYLHLFDNLLAALEAFLSELLTRLSR